MEQHIEQVKVPYVVHESDLARSDLKNKRLWMTLNGMIGVLAVILIATIIRSSRNETSKRFVN